MTPDSRSAKARKSLSDRQKNILRFMETYIDNHGFPPTIREIGEATSIASTSVVNYNLNKLVKAGFIAREARASRGMRLIKDSDKRRDNLRQARVASIKVCGTIVASAPAPIPDDIDRAFDEVVEIMPMLLRGADPEEVFALRVKGESMIDALVNHDDLIILRRQVTANNGDMVAVWLSDRGETTLKYFYNEGERIRLQPAHPLMDPIYVSPVKCQIQGRVLAVIRSKV